MVKKHRSKHGLMILKMDLKKAYDIIEWAFVMHVLNAWGFSSNFCEFIYNCLGTVSVELLINGGKRDL